MESPSQLESFLTSQKAEGTTVDVGHFTISKEKALEKLAAFQLPFEGAWAVKVIQAANSLGNLGPILVAQTAKETRFHFECASGWSIEELESGFFEPEVSHSAATTYLLSALWFVGIAEKRAFHLEFPNQPDCLLWDGQSLHRLAIPKTHDVFTLTVANFPKFEASVEWVAKSASAARNTVTVSQAIAEYCFCSARPVTIDQRRIDGFQFAPGHGWSAHSFPLSLTVHPGSSPNLPVPSGTLETLASNDTFTAGIAGVQKLVSRALTTSGIDSVEAAVGVLVSAQAAKAHSGKRTRWETEIRPSEVFWVTDGCVIQKERLDLQQTCVTLALFVSAQHLDCDLSGFSLSDSDPELKERERRLKIAIRLAAPELERISRRSLDELVSSVSSKATVVGGLMTVVGLATGLLFPNPASLAFIGGGLWTIKSGGQEEKELVKEYKIALQNLGQEVRHRAELTAGQLDLNGL